MFKITKLNIWIYGIINNYIYRTYDLYFNAIVRRQITNPKEIPIIIVNYNQLHYLKQLVNSLVKHDFKNIIIIDNKSTYQPLLAYYNEIKKHVTIEFMEENFGHAVFFKNNYLQKKHGKGFYVITDADIVPNKDLPDDFIKQLLVHLKKHWHQITKVGFALRLDDIPDENILKEKILKWEEKFWQLKDSEDIYIASLDTTFALYKPGYPNKYDNISYLRAHRFANNFEAKHGGWYIDQNNMTEEQRFFVTIASKSSSWLYNEKNLE
ncbi:glycosyltransferase family 2 protein [Kaistella sp. DKR-2]|uniref:glycosyltransferase family A protein n=1 Tax=Kaistella soli TaxID=2849654 RepID=UPI001C268D38|nr:glycosyltransferase family A protein [Kaistella soli]MBU8883073.1 glycosyltransferase family 2 protein [Kaistella soli]